jgi:hypothetical protein
MAANRSKQRSTQVTAVERRSMGMLKYETVEVQDCGSARKFVEVVDLKSELGF